MAQRTQFEGSNEVGVFAKLTNTYCLVAIGGSANFYSVFEGDLADKIPIVYTSIAGMRIIGRVCAGNKNGLLIPDTATDQELQHLRNSLPDSVKVQRIKEPLSALGNSIACNDYCALINPEFDKETEEIVEDVLGVEVYRQTIAGQSLVGTYCALNNRGGLVHSKVPVDEMNELATLLQVPIATGTVNRGCDMIGSGLVVNDYSSYCGLDTTSTELNIISNIFQLSDYTPSNISSKLRDALIDTLA